MAGRTGEADGRGVTPGFTYLPITADQRASARPCRRAGDLIYLCFPNNAHGAVASREAAPTLGRTNALGQPGAILFDAAYAGLHP